MNVLDNSRGKGIKFWPHRIEKNHDEFLGAAHTFETLEHALAGTGVHSRQKLDLFFESTVTHVNDGNMLASS